MKTHIKRLKIQNFKSIDKIELDCARINIIIGKPNVGKSNILEAISLLGGSYTTNDRKYLSEFIRYRKFRELFSVKDTSESILVQSDIGIAQVRHHFRNNSFDFTLSPDIKTLQKLNKMDLNKKGNLELEQLWKSNVGHVSKLPPYYKMIYNDGNVPTHDLIQWHSPVKKFEFNRGQTIDNLFHLFLLPPYGNNLYAIVKNNKKLTQEVAGFFKEYKLKFVFKEDEKEFGLQRDKGGVVYSYGYHLIADTLQRIIFNIAAIRSNRNSTLLFEEPEAHSFPYYVKLFANEIKNDESNQYFITTHSPFILNTLLEEVPENDIRIFVASYHNYSTKIKPLSGKEISHMLDYGNDIFFSPKLLT